VRRRQELREVKISGTHVLALPQERAYRLLQDPDVLARSMPGCEALVRIDESQYRMKMKMVLASFSGLFDGTVRITESEPPSGFRLVVEGKGKIGFMKGDGKLKLAPDGSATQVAYEGDVYVGGTLAAVGQRLVDTTARMMIKRFFEKLAESAGTAGA
jgi:carbon monoxide dehydrogenase subunit G